MKQLIVMILLILVLAACGSSDEVAKEVVVTREIEVTRIVEVTATSVPVTPTVSPTKVMQLLDTPEPIPTQSPIDYKIVDISKRVTEQNATWWKYAWRLTVRNNGPQKFVFDAKIKFLDTDGFIVDDESEYNLVINSYQEETYTGYVLIDTNIAGSVVTVSAETSVKQVLATSSSLPPSPTPLSPEPIVVQPMADVSTPLAPAVIPDGWILQEFYTNDSTFAYPSDWTITKNGPLSTELEKYDNGILIISITQIDDVESTEEYLRAHNSIIFSEDATTRATALRTALISTLGSVQFFREGTLDAPHQPTYITAIATINNEPVAWLVTYATDLNKVNMIQFVKQYPLSFTENDISIITDMIRSFDF